MKAYQWEYYSFRYYKASEQWQPESNDLNDKVFCNNLDELCEMLSQADWKPFLLNDHIVLFRRKKIDDGKEK